MANDERKRLMDRLLSFAEPCDYEDYFKKMGPDGFEGSAEDDKPIKITVSQRGFRELVAALDDADELDTVHGELHRLRRRESQLREDLRGARNPREVLRRYGLIDRDATTRKHLELWRCYTELVERRGFGSGDARCPVRYQALRHHAEAVPRRAFAGLGGPVLSSLPGKTHPAPVSYREAVDKIKEWFPKYKDAEDEAVLKALQRAKKSAQEAREDLDRWPEARSLPDPDRFQVPNLATL